MVCYMPLSSLLSIQPLFNPQPCRRISRLAGSMPYYQTEYALGIRNRCIKSKDHERSSIRRSQVSGVQSDETKSKGLYTCTCVTVPMYNQCSAVRLILKTNGKGLRWGNIKSFDPRVGKNILHSSS